MGCRWRETQRRVVVKAYPFTKTRRWDGGPSRGPGRLPRGSASLQQRPRFYDSSVLQQLPLLVADRRGGERDPGWGGGGQT